METAQKASGQRDHLHLCGGSASCEKTLQNTASRFLQQDYENLPRRDAALPRFLSTSRRESGIRPKGRKRLQNGSQTDRKKPLPLCNQGVIRTYGMRACFCHVLSEDAGINERLAKVPRRVGLSANSCLDHSRRISGLRVLGNQRGRICRPSGVSSLKSRPLAELNPSASLPLAGNAFEINGSSGLAEWSLFFV
jgi:hypothetical protein